VSRDLIVAVRFDTLIVGVSELTESSIELLITVQSLDAVVASANFIVPTVTPSATFWVTTEAAVMLSVLKSATASCESGYAPVSQFALLFQFPLALPLTRLVHTAADAELQIARKTIKNAKTLNLSLLWLFSCMAFPFYIPANLADLSTNVAQQLCRRY
jgi:hypothetical protein